MASGGRPEKSGGHPEALVELDNMSKAYGSIVAVQDASLRLEAGTVHAVLGENGAGKSTLAKAAAGWVRADQGRIRVAGRPVPLGSVKAARAAGVQCVLQELSLVPEWTVAQNLVLPSKGAAGAWIPKRDNLIAGELLEKFSLEINPTATVGLLGLGQRQVLEIVRALAQNPRLLILDEATSALSLTEVDWLFANIRKLKSEGSAVMYVSHRMAEIKEIADVGTIMRDGRVVGDFSRQSYDANALLTLMAGSPTEQFFHGPPVLPEESGSPALEVTGMSGEGITSINLAIRPGEVVGLAGLQGNGQSDLIAALHGLTDARAETWHIGDVAVERLSARRAVSLGQGMVPEDRKTSGLALNLPISANLLAPWLTMTGLGGRFADFRNRSWMARVMSRLGVKSTGPRQITDQLSGGNQQKIVVGRWLERDMKVLLLSDPTRGIDVGSKQEIYKVIGELAESGVGILWNSTELEELVHQCHRVLVMYRGQIVAELRGDSLTPETLVEASLGLNLESTDD